MLINTPDVIIYDYIWRKEDKLDIDSLGLAIAKKANEEIANAALYLMQSTYTTGSTLFIDGGYTFR